MGVWKSLAGVYTVEIISASPADTLTAINKYGVALFDVVYIDALRVRGSIYRFDYKTLTECLTKRGEEWSVLQRKGIYWTAKNLRNRPVLVLGCLLYLFVALYLPTRVLFVQVEGNEYIPSNQIIDRAENCGIKFGASRREVRSERMKNALLSAVPQLQWAGVNTVGCVAVISVEERTEVSKVNDAGSVSSIVASQDAVIDEVTVLRGNPLCKPGQIVKKGQVLVSGYTDCGLLIKAEAAEAEVFGKTLRHLEAITPVNYTKRESAVRETRQYSLQIGKNIINFCKDSGISGMECAKMYNKKILTLPGGFQLPVALITESTLWYDYHSGSDDPSATEWLITDAEIYLRNQMVAGRILSSDISVQRQDGVYSLLGQYSCREEIGQIRNEEKIISDE